MLEHVDYVDVGGKLHSAKNGTERGRLRGFMFVISDLPCFNGCVVVISTAVARCTAAGDQLIRLNCRVNLASCS